MSIESGIDKLASAISALAISGIAIADAITAHNTIAASRTASELNGAVNTSAISQASIDAAWQSLQGKVDEKPTQDSSAPQTDVSNANNASSATTSDASEAAVKSSGADSAGSGGTDQSIESTPPFDAPANGGTAPTLADVKNVLVATVQTHGKAAVAEVLASHGATRLPELDPDKYGKFIAACEKL